MRALVQRVKEAHVSVGGTVEGRIGAGLLVFVGVARGDTHEDAANLAQRCADLRIFEDAQGKMNLALAQAGGKILAVSQFTLYADTRRGNRPSFVDAAPPEQAERLYGEFVEELRQRLGRDAVQTGVFRAMMEVALVNDGPVTIMLESKH